MTEPKTDTLPAPGAVLHYEVRSADSSTHPARRRSPSPGGRDGFLGGEYGGMGKPDAFAATLHTLLDHA
jgi:hypothetical protein